MTRLSRNLQITAVVDAISIGLLVLLPKEAHGARLLGFSWTRLGIIVILILLLGFLVWSIRALQNNLDREQNVQQKLHDLMGKSWAGKVIQFFSALVVVLIINFSIGNIFLSNPQFRGIFLRLIPVFLVLFCIVVQILLFEPLRSAAGKWSWILVQSIICTVGGILVQKFLLSRLNHPYKISFLYFFGVWLALFFISVVLISLLSSLPKAERSIWRMVLVLAGVLFIFQWYFTPNREWSTNLALSLYGVMLVLGAVIITRLAYVLCAFLLARYQRKLRPFLLVGMGGIMLILAVLYYNGASLHAQMVNTDLTESDQNAYLTFAKDARSMGFEYAGDF